ncbi:hypothetical protein Patl1_32141 [Pistacia atlantica]|uniref:Uncharacterized protein n=1 Tax=Pistacia atlantica TaxID=434234 RepID=A0ACC1AQM4_9ROSI|nr:hypothetical protein Patl1_32141 [Pistacia atlantica]
MSFHNCDGIGPENSLSARSRTSRFDKDASDEGSHPRRPRLGRERRTTLAFLQVIPVHEQGDGSVPQSAIPSALVRPDLNAISPSNSEASAYGPEEHNNMTKNNLNLEQLEEVILKDLEDIKQWVDKKEAVRVVTKRFTAEQSFKLLWQEANTCFRPECSSHKD